MVVVKKFVSGTCSCKGGGAKTGVTGSREEFAAHGYRYDRTGTGA